MLRPPWLPCRSKSKSIFSVSVKILTPSKVYKCDLLRHCIPAALFTLWHVLSTHTFRQCIVFKRAKILQAEADNVT